jgi:ribonuclease P protein component
VTLAVVGAGVDGVTAMAPGRHGRLTRSADVQRALRRGRSRSGDLLAVHVFERTAAEEPGQEIVRMTVVASRRVGGAVRRNRAKRLLREAARTLPWRGGRDIVLVARAACADSDLDGVSEELAVLAGRLAAVEGDA